MNPRRLVLGTAGLALLAAAAWLVPVPRPAPRPDLPEIAPFAAGERIALVIPDLENGPPAETLGLVQRARSAGADVRICASRQDLGDFAPDRIYAPAPAPARLLGYHPDQWPIPPPGGDWQMLALTPAETAVRNAAVVAAARELRAAGAGEAREIALLARARRAEIYRTP
ncbi:MAG TPA: hypothetical protein P5204_04120 [Kiritimatiellia bacterium]|nr:hypothetical protein [Kiritimatiellia bacterium]